MQKKERAKEKAVDWSGKPRDERGYREHTDSEQGKCGRKPQYRVIAENGDERTRPSIFPNPACDQHGQDAAIDANRLNTTNRQAWDAITGELKRW
jgi:hypothetical protein